MLMNNSDKRSRGHIVATEIRTTASFHLLLWVESLEFDPSFLGGV